MSILLTTYNAADCYSHAIHKRQHDYFWTTTCPKCVAWMRKYGGLGDMSIEEHQQKLVNNVLRQM